MNKKNLKIAGATSMALFSLVAVFTATIAWFVALQNVAANTMRLKVTDERGRLNKIEIFELKEINKKNGQEYYSFYDIPSATMTYNWDSTSGTGIDSFPMGDYNPLSTEHPLLLLFTLRGEYASTVPGDIYIKGKTSAPGFLGETIARTINEGEENEMVIHEPKFNLDLPDDDHQCLKNGSKTITVDGVQKTVGCYPLSSAVNFRCTHYSADEFDAIHDETNGVIDILTNTITLRESFVNFEEGSDIEFKPKPLIYSSPGAVSGNDTMIQYIAMVVDYDGNAISAIYSTYLGNSILENTYGGALCYYCDWSLEVF